MIQESMALLQFFINTKFVIQGKVINKIIHIVNNDGPKLKRKRGFLEHLRSTR